MTGKILGLGILGAALIFGAVVWYAQVYYYYVDIPAEEAQVALTPLDGGAPEPIATTGFDGIDASSSPIRYRACFDTDLTLAELDARYEGYEGAAPRNAPFWFTCFDSDSIGEQIADGRARVFTGHRNIEFGIDRVVAITEDGRGYVWEEVNDCGDKAYDGTPLGEDCPPRD